jgi:hypothetical protein
MLRILTSIILISKFYTGNFEINMINVNNYYVIIYMAKHGLIGVCATLGLFELYEFIKERYVKEPLLFHNKSLVKYLNTVDFPQNNKYIENHEHSEHNYMFCSNVTYSITKPIVRYDGYRPLKDNEMPEILGAMRKVVMIKGGAYISDEKTITSKNLVFVNHLFGIIPYNSAHTYRKILSS